MTLLILFVNKQTYKKRKSESPMLTLFVVLFLSPLFISAKSSKKSGTKIQVEQTIIFKKGNMCEAKFKPHQVVESIEIYEVPKKKKGVSSGAKAVGSIDEEDFLGSANPHNAFTFKIPMSTLDKKGDTRYAFKFINDESEEFFSQSWKYDPSAKRCVLVEDADTKWYRTKPFMYGAIACAAVASLFLFGFMYSRCCKTKLNE